MAQSHVLYRSTHARVRASRASGVYIWDVLGRRYLDGSSGPLAANIGHSVPEVLAAIRDQLERMTFAHGSTFASDAQERAADLAVSFAPPGFTKVFFVSGGSEAVETAIKLARQYWVDAGRPEKFKIIGKRASYHGATLGALSASAFEARQAPFAPLLLPFPHIPEVDCRRCPFGLEYGRCEIDCASALDDAIRREGPETVAAFIAEPLSGAANGAAVPPPEYFPRIRAICDRHDVLFIGDEVMTGFGRTGANFALDHWGVVPDLIVSAKGLGAGYVPIGAVIAHERVAGEILGRSGRFVHGHTYAGNPLACAAAAAVLEYVRTHDLVAAARTQGVKLRQELDGLASLPGVADIRGLGLMWGVEFAVPAGHPAAAAPGAAVVEAAFRHGLLVYPSGGALPGSTVNQILVGPPLTVSDAQLVELGALLRESVREALG